MPFDECGLLQIYHESNESTCVPNDHRIYSVVWQAVNKNVQSDLDQESDLLGLLL